MPSDKPVVGFHMEYEYVEKMKFIAKKETRSLSNLLEHLSKLHIEQYEAQNGEIDLGEDIIIIRKNK